jgi:hypothetical protein
VRRLALPGYRPARRTARLIGVSTNYDATPLEPPEAGREVLRLIRRIQMLALKLEALRRRGVSVSELRAKERTLDRLHWRLVGEARDSATGDLGSAA